MAAAFYAVGKPRGTFLVMRHIAAASLFAAAGSAETEPRFAVPDAVSPEALRAIHAVPRKDISAVRAA
jgi:hypothetical protein